MPSGRAVSEVSFRNELLYWLAVRAAALTLFCVLALAACGGGGSSTFTPAASKACLKDKGIRVGGKLDFVATTATGGAFKAHVGSNLVTVSFGETVADGEALDKAYHEFKGKNIGIEDILERNKNAVMLWREHPTDTDLATMADCLKG